MKNEHERCSELLDRHVAGTLEPPEAEEVAGHLAECAECRTEMAAVRALSGVGEPEPLTELERARMRRMVLERAVPLPAEPAATRASGSGARWYQVLGAAAVIVAIAIFAYVGLDGSGITGGDDAGVTGAADGERGRDADTGAGGASESLEMQQGADTLNDGPASESATASKAAPLPEPAYNGDMGPIDRSRMNRMGTRGLSLVLFSRSYSVEDVPTYQAEFVEQLAGRAPTVRGQDIRDCAALVTSEFENALPAFAGFGEYKDRGDILVLTFAWTDADAGPLDKSMVWAWSIDGCDGTPVHYSTNVIRPRG